MPAASPSSNSSINRYIFGPYDIRAYAKTARPIRWTYTDFRRRIAAKEVAGTAH